MPGDGTKDLATNRKWSNNWFYILHIEVAHNLFNLTLLGQLHLPILSIPKYCHPKFLVDGPQILISISLAKQASDTVVEVL